jgi:hypothetical protein
MTWGLAQAGNRASKTGRYLQWWENRPEWDAMTSAVRNSRNSARFSNNCLHLTLGYMTSAVRNSRNSARFSKKNTPDSVQKSTFGLHFNFCI